MGSEKKRIITQNEDADRLNIDSRRKIACLKRLKQSDGRQCCVILKVCIFTKMHLVKQLCSLILLAIGCELGSLLEKCEAWQRPVTIYYVRISS